MVLATVHIYTPAVLPVRVWVYSAVVAAVAVLNTVTFPSVTVTVSLVQVTVVAGPPVEIQVRVNVLSGINAKARLSPGIVISPTV